MYFQFSSVAPLCLTHCNPMDCSMPVFPIHHQLPKLAQTHVHRLSDTIQLFHSLSSPSPLSLIFPSISIFSNGSVFCNRWPKYWSFSFSISPSSEYSGLISFQMDWFDLLVVLEKTESPLDHKEIKSVHLKGNQPWILTGWTDAEAEAPILWRLTWRVNTSEKTLMLLKTESKRRGWQKMNKFDGITDAMYVSFSKLQEIVNDKES